MILTMAAIAVAPMPAGLGAAPLLGVWIGAVVAGFAVVLHQAAALTKLREEIEGLEQKRAGGAVPASSSADSVRRGATPIFGGLYEAEPTVFDRLRARPALVLTLVAMILGGLSGALLVRDTEQIRALALAQRAEIAGVRSAHDSLSTLVARLRDSLTSPRPPAPAAEAARPAAPRSRGRGPVAPAPAVLPPPPRIDAVAPASH